MISVLMRSALQEYRAALALRFGTRLRLVRLFGSWARGQATEHSDVDVAVVIEGLTTAEWKAAHSDAADVALSTELSLSPLILSGARYDEMIQDGGIAREIDRDGIAP